MIITGSIDNLVFYEMEGKGYVRRKSSLTGKQFRTKNCFESSRTSAARFAKGNKIASEVYRNLPSGKQDYALFCSLKSKAIALLKQGADPENTRLILQQSLTR